MKIELEISGSQIGETVGEVFKSLTPEQHKELAEKVMIAWLHEPHDIERKAHDKEIIAAVRRNATSWSGKKEQSDDEIRRDYEYRQLMEKFESTKEKMVKQITEATIAHYKALVAEMVANDEKIKAAWEVTRGHVIANFPAYVQNAMMLFFCEHMGEIASGVMTNRMDVAQVKYLQDEVNKKLAQLKN